MRLTRPEQRALADRQRRLAEAVAADLERSRSVEVRFRARFGTADVEDAVDRLKHAPATRHVGQNLGRLLKQAGV
jgi:protoheme ferro-lyase